MIQVARRLALLALLVLSVATSVHGEVTLVRSVGNGRWSDPATWEGCRLPEPGDRVQIRTGHSVVFDSRIEAPIRSIHIAGTLDFDPDRDTLLTVGLIKVQAGDDPSESGLDGHGDAAGSHSELKRPSLLVGSARRPIAKGHTSVIRLAEVKGLDPEECPAIICLGGRMEFHGAEVGATWVKLGKAAAVGDSSVLLDRPVTGWNIGDRVIVTATRHPFHKNDDQTPKVLQNPQTEERIVRGIEGARLMLDAPLKFAHFAEGPNRGEVALLSRNVVVESANPEKARGHTMYHRDSVGSISYAEFRHLGKTGKLGKYSLHFHRVGDTMRGSSVVGASIWDSGNRWITIHGTNRLVVRDCVGYRSVGHGFFLEDGTEVDNILDGNLAVQACEGSPLPGQALAFDRNEGAGFWWANSRNAFVRNVAVECDAYGFRFEAPTSSDFNPVLPIRGFDGSTNSEDVRVLPFVRFDENESHAQRRYGVNLGGGPGSGTSPGSETVGPDSRHPFVIRNLRIWDSHWGFTPATPGLLIDNLDFFHCEYAFWKPNFDRHSYRGMKLYQCQKGYFETKGTPPDPAIFPSPLDPTDDRSPITVITNVEDLTLDEVRVSGTSMDDGQIKSVRVNGREVHPLAVDFSRWEVVVKAEKGHSARFTAIAEDSSGNVEKTPHIVLIARPVDAGSSATLKSHSCH